MPLRDLPGVPESRLPDGLQLPTSTPAPPWDCRVEATFWWHRATPAGRALVPAPLRPGLPLTVAAFIHYLDTPVGAYNELLASPHLVRGAVRRRSLARIHVPFIAVDSIRSIHGGRAHWALPKTLAVFHETAAVAPTWAVTARAATHGPRLPGYGRLGSSQVVGGQVTSAITWARAQGRLAQVDVDVTSEGALADWLLPGRHRGVVLRGRMVVGPASPERA